jgi:putative addiction module component (TIGR02574 family)
MSLTAEQVLQAAMALPEAERAEIAARLQHSVSIFATPEVAAAWEAEIAARLKAIDDESVELIPAEEVHRQMREKHGFFAG